MRHYKGLWQTKMVWVVVLLLAFLPTALAMEWDNRITNYNEITETVTIENVYGLGEKLADIQLLTPKINYVIEGKDRLVARFKLMNYKKDYESQDTIKNIQTYNTENLDKEIGRQVNYKYKEIYFEDETNYVDECSTKTEVNGTKTTTCNQIKNGTKQIEKERWIEFTSLNELPIGDIEIGLFADVYPNDKVEWIPTFFGTRITQWATWQSSFNVGLVAYYPLENNTDVVSGKYNLSDRAGTYGGGKVGNALSNDYIYQQFIMPELNTSSVYNYTACFWTNDSTTGGASHGVFGLLDTEGEAIDVGRLGFGHLGTGTAWQAFLNAGGESTSLSQTRTAWYFHCLTKNSTTFAHWENGAIVASDTSLGTWNGEIAEVLIGAYRADGNAKWTGLIDELGLWNRTLTTSEITDIYNGGSGMTYIPTPTATLIELTINLASYPNNSYISTKPITLTFNSTAFANNGNLTNATLYVWNTSTTRTYSAITGMPNSTAINISYTLGADASYIWNVEYCTVNISSTVLCRMSLSNNSFTIDSLSPNITILNPLNNSEFTATLNPSLNNYLNFTINDSLSNLSSCWYNLDGGSNTTFTSLCNSTRDMTAWGLYNVSIGNHTLNFYVNDTLNNVGKKSVSFFILLLNSSASEVVYETSNETFELNLTYDTTKYTNAVSYLNYNGTIYSTTQNGNIFTKIIDIPIISADTVKNYKWQIELYNGTAVSYINSSGFTQNVSMIHLALCNATYPVNSLNFTVWDEGNLSRLTPYELYGTIYYWLGSGSVTKNLSINKPMDNETSLCISPNKTFYGDTQLKYGKDGWIDRDYWFDDYTFDNTNENLNLYLLTSSDSTTFIQYVQSIQQVPEEDVYIYQYRYYPETDDYALVAISLTDNNGKTVGFYKTETVYYKHILKQNGVTVLDEEKRKVFAESAPYTISFTIGTTTGSPLIDFKDLDGLGYNLSFNKNTKIVSFAYSDANSSFASARLYVWKENYSTFDTVLCNSSSALAAATLTCNLAGINGSFTAQGFVTRTSAKLIDTIIIKINEIYDTFGNLGLLFAWMIILTSCFAFMWHPLAGVWGITISTIFVNLIGIASFGGVWIFGLIAISIILSIIWR